MTRKLTAEQLAQLKALLLDKQRELQADMQVNREDLAPPSTDEGHELTEREDANNQREVRQQLGDIDLADFKRVQDALAAMADGEYGLCVECGKPIAFERLLVEPMTQHCVACKSAFEQAQRKGF